MTQADPPALHDDPGVMDRLRYRVARQLEAISDQYEQAGQDRELDCQRSWPTYASALAAERAVSYGRSVNPFSSVYSIAIRPSRT